MLAISGFDGVIEEDMYICTSQWIRSQELWQEKRVALSDHEADCPVVMVDHRWMSRREQPHLPPEPCLTTASGHTGARDCLEVSGE
jgi:hypothetical protein